MYNLKKPLLKWQNISKTYFQHGHKIHALRDVSLEIFEGETLGLAGESGCGKSTLGKIALHLELPSLGQVYFKDEPLLDKSTTDMRQLRCQMQMIFQDPLAALNPRMKIENIVGEGIDIHKLAKGAQRRQMIVDLLKEMDLDESVLLRYPHEFSGGQRQRISIARALVVNPSFVVCDEPLSALDVCTQQHVIKLLKRIKSERKLSLLFISHDLHAMRKLSDRIAVMYLGKIVEIGTPDEIFNETAHPYTQALLSAIPVVNPGASRKPQGLALIGTQVSPLSLLEGCAFHPRCPHATEECRKNIPVLKQKSEGHYVACHHAVP